MFTCGTGAMKTFASWCKLGSQSRRVCVCSLICFTTATMTRDWMPGKFVIILTSLSNVLEGDTMVMTKMKKMILIFSLLILLLAHHTHHPVLRKFSKRWRLMRHHALSILCLEQQWFQPNSIYWNHHLWMSPLICRFFLSSSGCFLIQQPILLLISVYGKRLSRMLVFNRLPLCTQQCLLLSLLSYKNFIPRNQKTGHPMTFLIWCRVAVLLLTDQLFNAKSTKLAVCLWSSHMHINQKCLVTGLLCWRQLLMLQEPFACSWMKTIQPFLFPCSWWLWVKSPCGQAVLLRGGLIWHLALEHLGMEFISKWMAENSQGRKILAVHCRSTPESSHEFLQLADLLFTSLAAQSWWPHCAVTISL